MPTASNFSHFGPPSLKIAGTSLWVHGRERPDSEDLWDGNWLRITAYCNDNGANITVSGAILTTMDVESFISECDNLYGGLAGEATLKSCEPNLVVTLRATDRLGHIEMSVHITPNHMTQLHEIKFAIDQSYLPAILAECRAILQAYPVRGGSNTNGH
jgi:hypothetical protein